MDDQTFLDAFHEHLDRLHNLARGVTRTTQDAEDLASDLPAGLRGWGRQRPDDAAAWFATICLDAARSSHRRQAARPVEVRADGRRCTRRGP